MVAEISFQDRETEEGVKMRERETERERERGGGGGADNQPPSVYSIRMRKSGLKNNEEKDALC